MIQQKAIMNKEWVLLTSFAGLSGVMFSLLIVVLFNLPMFLWRYAAKVSVALEITEAAIEVRL